MLSLGRLVADKLAILIPASGLGQLSACLACLVLCSGCDGEGLNVKRGSFEAEGRKHWGGTFCYSWMLCLGLRSFVLCIVILS